MKKYFTLLLLVITFQAIAQTYPITGINISLPASPDANTANWKSGTSLFTITATTLADNGRIAPNVIASKILVTIKKGGVKVYGDYTINSAPASDFNTPNKIYRGDSAVSFLGKSFILPPGDYEICVQFFGNGVAGLTPISEEKTKAFSISTDVPVFQAPQVIAPANGTVFSETELQKPIIFSWMPVVPKPQDPVNYRLTVWQLMQGQNGVQAMKVNQPLITKDVDNITQLTINSIVGGPCLPPYMCDFIWNVQALNREGKPIGENNGTSRANTFQIEYESATTNMCDNFNFELRKIYKGDSISYACILTNKYTGKELGYVPKSFSIEIKNNLVIAVDDYAPKEWNRTPSKFPPGSSQIKWTNNSGDIPNGEINLGAIHFGVATANPFYVIYEWINKDEKIICRDSIALIETIKLITPVNGAKIVEGLRPSFEWLPPMPVPPGYRIKIVEILGNQSPDQAMLMNAAWYENTEIRATSITYPATALRLEPDKLYGWLVDYFLGGQPINGLTGVSSEVWTFTIQGPVEPAKVSVLLQQPLPYRLFPEDLWNGTLTNIGGTILKVLLTGTLEKTGTGKIVESKTGVLSLNPGKTKFFYSDFNTDLVNSIFDRWGNLIAGIGDYTACIQVKNESGVEIGSGCIVQRVETPTSVNEVKLQQSYNLEQNYPNPFSSTSTIGYSVAQTSQVKIIVYDLYGKEIKVLVNEEKAPGHHEIVFDRKDFVSGIYFYTLKTAGFIQSKKMILMK